MASELKITKQLLQQVGGAPQPGGKYALRITDGNLGRISRTFFIPQKECATIAQTVAFLHAYRRAEISKDGDDTYAVFSPED